ncbi:hypothetical protein IAR55_007171 [Kwoniella newhampshirensis]|uniref:Uncharacterized protein n=1 Tax=Kwoniella newhampshirensis TaxID=1651941 RepID=A0AAW0YT48_9TREE
MPFKSDQPCPQIHTRASEQLTVVAPVKCPLRSGFVLENGFTNSPPTLLSFRGAHFSGIVDSVFDFPFALDANIENFRAVITRPFAVAVNGCASNDAVSSISWWSIIQT